MLGGEDNGVCVPVSSRPHLLFLVCRICLFLLVAGVLLVLILSSGKVKCLWQDT